MTNPARDLAATGTQGEWGVGNETLIGVDVEDAATSCSYAAVVADLDSMVRDDCDDIDALNADALKIVRAVNALPAIADLLDAIDAAIEGADAWGTCGHEWADLKKFAAARDAVAAALTGETP